MIEYESKPYAKWLEEVLPQMVELDPVSIGIEMILQDGTVGTVYYAADNGDRLRMANSLLEDNLIELIKTNAAFIVDILQGEESDDEDGCAD